MCSSFVVHEAIGTERKEQQQTLDYDDLLLFWHYLMTEPACGDMVRQKFNCVLVDEYQDTNTLQAEIVNGLCPEGKGLTVVGDDAQSVYSFRAATVQNILDFPTQFPDELLPWFEPVTMRRSTLEFPQGDTAGDVTTADVRKRIGRMWA